MNKKLIICALVMLMIMLTGCETPEEDTIESTTTDYNFEEYRDPETGVHYLIYSHGYRGGLSVRYNEDGTIMID